MINRPTVIISGGIMNVILFKGYAVFSLVSGYFEFCVVKISKSYATKPIVSVLLNSHLKWYYFGAAYTTRR